MRINHLFMAVSASLMLAITSCAPTMEEKTNQAIKDVMNEFEAVGVSAAVVKNGQIVYNESFGYANLENKTPLTNEHIMRIASISKSFTATSLLQLVERGIISLDDDVSDLIGFQMRNPRLKISTFHQHSYLSPLQLIRYKTLFHLNLRRLAIKLSC